MTRLPSNPSLKHLRLEAKSLLKAHKNGDTSCCSILRQLHQFKDKTDVEVVRAKVSLQEVQFALAMEYGFKNWTELKKSALKRISTGQFLHIHPGDASGEILRESKIPGDVLVWREIYVEGPVPGNLPERDFLEIRAKFLATTFGLDYDALVQGGSERHKRIKEADKYDEVILWFDACMFDQTIMIHLMDLCARQPWEKTKLSLICIGEFAGIDRFSGLGELSPGQLASLFETRHEVTQEEKNLAGKAWQAFTSDDPRDIEKLLQGDCSALPYLRDAMVRHLQQFPSVRNGLNRLENQILAAAASGAKKLGEIFRTVSDMEERRFAGDTSVWRCIHQLAACRKPLLLVSGPCSLTELLKINSGEQPDLKRKKRRLFEVDITEIGKEALAGRRDAVGLNGIDKWIGGVHLQGAEAVWRWDEANGKLTT